MINLAYILKATWQYFTHPYTIVKKKSKILYDKIRIYFVIRLSVCFFKSMDAWEDPCGVLRFMAYGGRQISLRR
jgi:hypothetical protein